MRKKIVSAGIIQAKADLKPQLLGIGFISFVITPAIFILIGRWLDGSVEGASTTIGSTMIAGVVGGFSAFLIIQFAQEMWLERLNGTMLRVKTLPNGIRSWMLGKTLSSSTLLFLQVLVILVIAPFALSDFSVSGVQVAHGLAITVLSLAAMAPLAFLLASFARGTLSVFVVYLLGIVVFALSGAAVPVTFFPPWLEAIAEIFPSYWSTLLAQQTILPEQTLDALGIPQGGSWIALAVLLAWAVLGSILVAPLVKRSFRKETLGSLSFATQKFQSQIGIG